MKKRKYFKILCITYTEEKDEDIIRKENYRTLYKTMTQTWSFRKTRV
jgi:hypothetical protein